MSGYTPIEQMTSWLTRMLDTIEKRQPISRNKLKDIIVTKYHYSTSDTNGSFHASLRLLLVDGYINVGRDGKIRHDYNNNQ